MEEVIDTIKILSELEKNKDPGKHFIDFLHNNSFEAGILSLSPGQKDIQDAHGADEIYFVIEGTGFIRIYQKDHPVKKGACIFVPSNAKHYFHGNENDLIVLYVFNVSH